MRAEEMRYEVSCPDCGQDRTVGYQAIWSINKGINSGRCHPCSVELRVRSHIESVLAKVGDPDSNGCWPWLGYVNRAGYGVTSTVRGGRRGAYRVVWEILVGEIPAGLDVDHLCRNPICVNPGHLEPVTHAENVRRGARARDTGICRRGHPFDEQNTYRSPEGWRACRACRRELARERKAAA